MGAAAAEAAHGHGASCHDFYGHHQGIYINDSYPRYSTQDYWFNHVLHWSYDVAIVGEFQTALLTAFTIAWVIVFIYFSKFFTYFRKVVYFTPSFPYIILIACLTGSLSLEGSKEGIKKFLIPDFSKLKEIKIWRDAVTQVFFSTAVASGSMYIFGHHHCSPKTIKKQVFLLSFLDCVTSFIAGVVTFSALGHLKFILNAPKLEMAARGGAGLVFITYPVAFKSLPTNSFWAFCFFFVLFLLGLDCQFELLETLVVSLQARFAVFQKYHTVVWAGLCVSCFICGLPCMTQIGYYILDILDVHGGAFPLLFLAMVQTIGVAYIYGVNNFARLVKSRLGVRVSTYWKVLWIVSPVFLGILFLVTIVTAHHRLTHLQGYHYPEWSTHFGWALSVIPIFIFVITGCVVVAHRFKKFSSHSLSFQKRLWMAIAWSVQPGKLLRLEPQLKEQQLMQHHYHHHHHHRKGRDVEQMEGHRNYGYTSSEVNSTCSSSGGGNLSPRCRRSPRPLIDSPRLVRSPSPISPQSPLPSSPQSGSPLPRFADYPLPPRQYKTVKHDDTLYEIPIRSRLPSDVSDFSSVSQHKPQRSNDLQQQQQIQQQHHFRYPPIEHSYNDHTEVDRRRPRQAAQTSPQHYRHHPQHLHRHPESAAPRHGGCGFDDPSMSLQPPSESPDDSSSNAFQRPVQSTVNTLQRPVQSPVTTLQRPVQSPTPHYQQPRCFRRGSDPRLLDEDDDDEDDRSTGLSREGAFRPPGEGREDIGAAAAAKAATVEQALQSSGEPPSQQAVLRFPRQEVAPKSPLVGQPRGMGEPPYSRRAGVPPANDGARFDDPTPQPRAVAGSPLTQHDPPPPGARAVRVLPALPAASPEGFKLRPPPPAVKPKPAMKPEFMQQRMQQRSRQESQQPQEVDEDAFVTKL